MVKPKKVKRGVRRLTTVIYSQKIYRKVTEFPCIYRSAVWLRGGGGVHSSGEVKKVSFSLWAQIVVCWNGREWGRDWGMGMG